MKSQKLNHLNEYIKLVGTFDITVIIYYREYLFEKTIDRQEEDPYMHSSFIPTQDLQEAIIFALESFINSQKKRSVHWQAKIVGVEIRYLNRSVMLDSVEEITEYPSVKQLLVKNNLI